MARHHSMHHANIMDLLQTSHVKGCRLHFVATALPSPTTTLALTTHPHLYSLFVYTLNTLTTYGRQPKIPGLVRCKSHANIQTCPSLIFCGSIPDSCVMLMQKVPCFHFAWICSFCVNFHAIQVTPYGLLWCLVNCHPVCTKLPSNAMLHVHM